MTDQDREHRGPEALPAGHPLATFRRENEAIRRLVGEIRRDLDVERDLSAPQEQAKTWKDHLRKLQAIPRHYFRKESLLFAYLERYGVVEPARDMWRLDTEIARGLAALPKSAPADAADLADTPGSRTGSLLDDWLDRTRQAVAPLLDLIASMVVAEEEGLLPLCASRLTAEDWAEIQAESRRLGPGLVSQEAFEFPPLPQRSPAFTPETSTVQFATGRLTLEQLEILLATLPIDLTFVDANDRIVFYSDPPGRLFSRTPAIIGRPLSHCHPPAAEAMIERMMTRFRTGQSDAVESFSKRDGQIIRTLYMAVRGVGNRYAGCLEMVQDITRFGGPVGDDDPPHYREVPVD
jgi:DUF438 domain-containing protein